MNNNAIKAQIEKLIENGYGETHVGYHAKYIEWKGFPQRGCYAHIAAPYDGSIRLYANSYSELADLVAMAKEDGLF